MPLNFPSNATNGDLYTGTNNILYTYDGTKWNASGQQGSIIPSANLTYDLGSTSSQWRHLYVGTSTIYIGGTSLSIGADGQLIIDGAPITGVPANVGDLSFLDTTIYSTTGVRLSNRGISTTGTAQIIVPEVNDNVQPIELRNIVGSVGINTGIDENNLQFWEFGRQGTLSVPNRNTLTFTAICDPNHASGELTLTDDPWTFEVTFTVLADGNIETHIPNWLPWGSNPGYTSGQQFSFTADDHGIPGYTFDLTLIDIQNPGPFMYTTNLAVNAAPEYPGTFESQGAIKITAGQKDWTLSSSGDLALPGKWPIAFTAQFDQAHYSGYGQLQGDGTASFNLELQGMGTTFQWAADDPTYETNRGYVGTQEFKFKDVDHGITGYILTINMTMAGDDEQGWSHNVTLSADPTVADLAKIRSTDEIMIRSGLKGWLFDTNGDIYLPSGGDIRNSAGTSVLGGGYNNTSTLVNGTYTLQLSVGGGQPYVMFPPAYGTQMAIQGNEIAAQGTATLVLSSGNEGGDVYINAFSPSVNTWVFDRNAVLTFPGGSTIQDLAGETLNDSLMLLGAGTTIAENQRAARIAVNGSVEGVAIGAGSNDWTFTNNGTLTFPNSSQIRVDEGNIEFGGMTNFNVEASGVVNIYTDTNGETPYQWQFGNDGELTFPDGSTIGPEGITVPADETFTITTSYTVLGSPPAGPTTFDWAFQPTGFLKVPTGGGIETVLDEDLTINVNATVMTSPPGPQSLSYMFKGDGKLQLPDIYTSGIYYPGASGFSLTSNTWTWRLNYGGTLTFPDGTNQSTAWTGSISTLTNGSFTANLDSNGFFKAQNFMTVSDGILPGAFIVDGLGDMSYTMTPLEDSSNIDSLIITGYVGKATRIGSDGNQVGWTFTPSGNIIFPDSTVQNTAYVASAEPKFNVVASSFTATVNTRYGVSTTATAVTVNLPPNPSIGDAVFFADAGGNFSSNNLTINRNGNTIMGAAANTVINVNGDSLGLFWNGSTWRLYE